METKNVIINKTFEVPVIITTQKVISVPDFTNLTTAINNNIKAEKENYEICNTNILAASDSMTKQLGEYFKALLIPLIGDGTDEHNLLKWLAEKNRFCVKLETKACSCSGNQFLSISLENYEYLKDSNGNTCQGVEIKLGKGYGTSYPSTYYHFALTYNKQMLYYKYTHTSKLDSFFAEFAGYWKLMKPKFEEKIRIELEKHQKYYENQTQSKYSDLVAIANFEI